MQVTSFYGKKIIPCRHGFIDLSTPVVMGILNLTPDSFFDGGKYLGEEQIIGQVNKMVNEGATIVDIGAESTRPGAQEISISEELNRLIPIVITVRKQFPSLIISIDTTKHEVAKAALDAGADIINDISGGIDTEMFGLIAKEKVPYILMHIQGNPSNMQQNPQYKDVVNEVYSYLEQRINALTQNGVENIIIDPGFGFGKTVEHNYQLLKNLSEFKNLGLPILVGLSRKSMINKVLNISAKEALNGTTALNTIALLNGASILRVHDVKEAKEVIELTRHLL